MRVAPIKTLAVLEQTIAAHERLRKKDRRPILTVSAGTCGRARGALKVVDALRTSLRKAKIDKKVRLRVTGCHGYCEAEPNIIVQPHDLFYQKVDPKDAALVVSETIRKKKPVPGLFFRHPATGKPAKREKDIPFYAKQKRLVLGDNARIDPTSIDDYFSIGGYSALAKVLRKLG
ncbi:MAG: hydrogenase, partial [Acidobacteria bacterium]|nr:hydrogenase [Acidobacteriota bacterium]